MGRRLLNLLLGEGTGERRVWLLAILIPHLENDHFLDVPVLAFAFEVLKGGKMMVTNHLNKFNITYAESLRLLVLILGDPVGREGYRRHNENETKVATALTFALLCQE